MKPPEYTPEEAALKAELESLAQTIQPDLKFLAALENELILAELFQSATPKKRGVRSLYWIAASLAAVLLCVGGIFFYFISSDDGSLVIGGLTATAITQNNQEIETEVAASRTAEIAQVLTPTPTQFSATLMSPIRSTATLSAPTVGVIARSTATASPSPTLQSFNFLAFLTEWRSWLDSVWAKIFRLG